MCTEPVTAQMNKARVVGIRLDKSAVLLLSLSPHGMEDVPLYIKTEIEQIAKNIMNDLNAYDLKEATKIICGSARSMGIEVKE